MKMLSCPLVVCGMLKAGNVSIVMMKLIMSAVAHVQAYLWFHLTESFPLFSASANLFRYGNSVRNDTATRIPMNAVKSETSIRLQSLLDI